MIAKQLILRSIQSTGLFGSLAGSAWRHERLLILCYHGISIADEHAWRPSSFMTPDHFESRMKALRDGGYTVLPLEEGVTRLYANTLPPKSVVITFDDGLYNFYSLAYPILKKYGFPSTLYLTTYYCDPQRPVFPLIASYLFWKSRGYVMSANPFLGFPEPVDLRRPELREQAEDAFAAFAAQHELKAGPKGDLIHLLARHLGIDLEPLLSQRLFHLITPAEAKTLDDNGVDIQLHTHRHRTPKDQEPFQKEVTENRAAIQALTGKTATHFCYPSGVYRMPNLPWLRELSVASATTCDHALAHTTDDPLLLPRFLDSTNVSDVEFDSWLTGVAAFVRGKLGRR